MSEARSILVTGGAGYIGSHTLRALLEAGYHPVVFDNLTAGHRKAIPRDVPFFPGDLAYPPDIDQALERFRPQAVVHFAALIEAGESMVDPARFYRNNVQNSINLFDAMVRHDVRRLIFSSTAGVYGQPEQMPIHEETPTSPVNTYGRTKLMVEQILRDYSRAYGLHFIALRYFNACGALPGGEIGEAHPNKTHLIELALLTALGKRAVMKVFGTDYPTPDGTAVRDYIHVCDLARAHVVALAALENGVSSTAYNVGVGKGFSVKEVLDVVERVTGITFPRVLEARREGDPAVLVADASRIRQQLGWEPTHTSLEPMIESAWEWHRQHPDDFEDQEERGRGLEWIRARLREEAL